MTPSPLSDVDLRDIHAAVAPEFWPPAPGWWLLAITLTVISLFTARYLIHTWRQRQQRRGILEELDNINARSPAEVATHVSTLLRRVALMRFERNEVASLSGEAWLSFLDRTGGNGAFSNGVGNVLATAPYAAHGIDDADSKALVLLARNWIHQNFKGHS